MSANYYGATSYKSKTKTLTITSGKGGVGKTTLVANVAAEIAKTGKKVLILDGDFGMANVDIMYGVRPEKNLADVISDRADMSDVVTKVNANIDLISGGSGLRELHKMSDTQRRTLIEQIGMLPTSYDYLIVDTAPGIDDNVLFLNAAVSEVNVIVTPEPASIADSYALIKMLNLYYKVKNFSLIANMVRDEVEAMALYKRLSDVAQKFLCVSLDFAGYIPMDSAIRQATKSQQLISHSLVDSSTVKNLNNLVNKLRSSKDLDQEKGGVQYFWEQVFGVA